MAAKDPNLKVSITSDSSKFVAGTKQAKDAVRDFQRTTDSALGQLGDAFGVNTGRIKQMTSSLQGLGIELSKSGNAGVKAFGNLLGSLNAVKLGIAGLGIGAAIASFKALNATAEAFKNTVQGANIEMATAAYVSTYRQAFFDMNSAQGQAFANFMSNLNKVWAAAGAVLTSTLTNAGKIASDVLLNAVIPGPPVNIPGLSQTPGLIRDTANQMKDANEKASRAAEISKEIYDLELQRLSVDDAVKQRNQEISALKVAIADKTKTEQERLQATARAQELIRQNYTEQYDVESRIADLIEERNDLTSSSIDDLRAANAQRDRANDLVTQMNSELRSLVSRESSLVNSISAGSKAERDAAKAAQDLSAATARATELQSQYAERVTSAAAVEARIAELREQAADSTADESTRVSAIVEAQRLIGSLVNGQYAAEAELADLMERINAATGATPAMIDQANQQRVLAIALQTEAIRNEQQLSRLRAGTATSADTEAASLSGVADAEQRILDLKRIIADTSSSETTRAQALSTAVEVVRQKYAQQYALEMGITASLEEQARLTGDNDSLLEEANQHRSAALTLAAGMKTEIQGLIDYQKQLTEAVKETQQAYAGVSSPTPVEQTSLAVPGIQLPGATTTPEVNLAGYPGQVEAISKAIIDLKSSLSDLASDGAAALGSLIGDLINGENAWSNFGNAALSALGDMAVAVGKTIMQEGIAVEAAKLALTTMSGVGAITAGAALIAIGSALKTSLRNAASGSYSASTGVASSSYGRGSSSTSREYEDRTFNVQVTGTLQASGSQLVAVLNNENNRKSHTT